MRAANYSLALQVSEALILRFEGLILHPYLCPAGVPTISAGLTHYLDGRPVKLTDPPITREVAIVMLRDQVRRVYLPAVLRLCPNVADPHRLAAIIDFAFNLGAGSLQASNYRRAINRQDWPKARIEVMKWVYAAHRKLRGLVLRRQAERALL